MILVRVWNWLYVWTNTALFVGDSCESTLSCLPNRPTQLDIPPLSHKKVTNSPDCPEGLPDLTQRVTLPGGMKRDFIVWWIVTWLPSSPKLVLELRFHRPPVGFMADVYKCMYILYVIIYVAYIYTQYCIWISNDAMVNIEQLVELGIPTLGDILRIASQASLTSGCHSGCHPIPWVNYNDLTVLLKPGIMRFCDGKSSPFYGPTIQVSEIW